MKRVSASARQRASAVRLGLLALWCSGALALHVVTNVSADVAPDPIAEIEAAYLRGEYASVIQVGEALAAQPAMAARQEQLWYLTGMAHLQRGEFAEAEQALQQVVTQFPEGRWRPEAELGMADIQWQTGDPAGAVTRYEELQARLGAAHPLAVRLQYQLGMAARAAGQWDKARAALQGVVQQFPQSFEAALAQQVLQQAEFAFTIQVGAFGVSANALRLQRELARRGYAATVDRTTADGQAIHRVRVGQFATREEADRTAQRLRADGFPAKVVP